MRIFLCFLISVCFNSVSISQVCDTVEMFRTTQKVSSGLATDGSLIWVAGGDSVFDSESNIITIHDEFGNQLNSFHLAQDSSVRASAMEIQEDTLWVVSEDIRRLYKLDKMTGTLFNDFELPSLDPSGPDNLGLTFGVEYLWNVEYSFFGDFSYLYKIKPLTGVCIDTIFVPVPKLAWIELINETMYGITFSGEEIFEIDKETGDTTRINDWCLEDPSEFDYFEENTLIGIGDSNSVQGAQSIFKISGLEFLTSVKYPDSSKLKQISIYPNPTVDVIRLSLGQEEDFNIKIFNSTGHLCFSEKFTGDEYVKNISNYPAGIYFMQIKIGDTLQSEKFVIAR